MSLAEDILEIICKYYLESHDFNGISTDFLATRYKLSPEDIISILTDLVENDYIALVFGDIHPNPNIRALPDEPKGNQIRKIQERGRSLGGCVYPLKKALTSRVNSNKYEGRPFTLLLALGEPQLLHKAFDLSVLEHYRNDPRYYYKTDGIAGSIGVTDKYFESKEMPEKDQIILQTFGFAYDQNINRAVAVYLRYLSDLSPEHQQIWCAKLLDGEYFLHPEYFRMTIIGDFPKKTSIFTAFLEELKIINNMCDLMGRPHLFLNEFSGEGKPREFGFIVRTTLGEYNTFVHLLDKMISENINKEFFQNEIPYEIEMPRGDGKIVVEKKGTLTLLSDWLNKYFHTEDNTPLQRMIQIFKDIRKERQHPAHAVDENIFDQEFFKKQRELIIRAYEGVRLLRLIFANHPAVGEYEIRSQVRDGEIWTY